MIVESKTIKDVLINAIDEYHRKSKMASSDTVKAALAGVSSVLGNLLMVIVNAEKANITEEEFMQKVQNELVSQVVSLNDIEIRRRTSELENQLSEVIDGLKPGQAALMSDKIKYGHLSTKISQMRSKKDGWDKVHVVKRGDKTYLVKK